MASNLVDGRKVKGGFRIDKKVKTPHIRVECGNCFEKDSVCSYESDIHERDFGIPYHECESCKGIFCDQCVGDGKCPECGGVEFFRIKPLHIYVCNICVNEKERVCPECRYPELEETFLFPG